MSTDRAPDRYPVRRSPRLGFDYGRAGIYFLTVCTAKNRELFGRITGDRMRLSRLGEMVVEELSRIATLRRTVSVDAFVVMPNHLHAIVVLHCDRAVHLGAVVNQFKAAVTRRNRAATQRPIDVWQRSYYERIVRNDRDLAMTREYIAANPARWAEDRENIRRRPRALAPT